MLTSYCNMVDYLFVNVVALYIHLSSCMNALDRECTSTLYGQYVDTLPITSLYLFCIQLCAHTTIGFFFDHITHKSDVMQIRMDFIFEPGSP